MTRKVYVVALFKTNPDQDCSFRFYIGIVQLHILPLRFTIHIALRIINQCAYPHLHFKYAKNAGNKLANWGLFLV